MTLPGTCGCSAARSAPLLLLALWSASPASAKTYQVGAGKPYGALADLPALGPGDVVEVSSGRYPEAKLWRDSGSVASPIVIRGVGPTRPVIDATGITVDGVLPRTRAVFQVQGGNIVIENFELINARNGANGSGVRVTSSTAVNVVIRGCKIHDCDMGIQSDGNDDLLIESCEIYRNGTSSYDGYSHNLYLGGGKATVRYSYIYESLNGQNIKSRGHYTELLYNYIAASQDGEIGLVDDTETAQAHSNALLLGNVVVSKARLAGYNGSRFIWFGQDQGGAHNGVLYALNNTFVAADSRIVFLQSNTSGASIVASNNVFVGGGAISGGGPLSGTRNWVSSGLSIPSGLAATISGATPGFADAAQRNYQLTSGSTCIDSADPAPSYRDGSGRSLPGIPTFQYERDLAGVTRPTDGQLDIGAYEYAAPSAPPVLRAPQRLRVL